LKPTPNAWPNGSFCLTHFFVLILEIVLSLPPITGESSRYCNPLTLGSGEIYANRYDGSMWWTLLNDPTHPPFPSTHTKQKKYVTERAKDSNDGKWLYDSNGSEEIEYIGRERLREVEWWLLNLDLSWGKKTERNCLVTH